MLLPWPIFPGVGIAAAAGASVLAYGTFVPSSNLWGRVINHGDRVGSRVSLTFDDGPTNGPTQRVLDLLGKAAIPATFFVIGRNCIRAPDLLRRIHAEGHLIGNHSWDHSHFGTLGRRRFWDEQLRKTDDAIAQIVGVRPALFRPPMGHKTLHTMRAAKRFGKSVVGWTRGARDGLATNPGRIMQRLADSAAGDILLMHDGIEPNLRKRDPSATLAALPMVLDLLAGKQLNIVRVDELVGCDGYQTDGPKSAVKDLRSR